MIRTFRNVGTRDIAAADNTKAARKVLPAELAQVARYRLAVINRSKRLDDLANTPGLRLEKLRGNRHGQWSIRINKQYRICFDWDGADATNVEIVDYH